MKKIWFWLIFIGFIGSGIYTYVWYKNLPCVIGKVLAQNFLN